jgi:N-acylglucosamine-6-phosphate 2-epimerase
MAVKLGTLRYFKEEQVSVIEQLRGGLIVSVQPAGPALDRAEMMVAFAREAQRAGCVGYRTGNPRDTRAVATATGLPVIGIPHDGGCHHEPGVVTYRLDSAREIVEAGGAIVTIEGSRCEVRGPLTLPEFIRGIHEELGALVMADVSCLEEGLAAVEYGADLMATTMSGYTPHTAHLKGQGPDLDLVRALAERVDVPVIAEGRYHTGAQAAAALPAGAWAVVVGTAITNPYWITSGFVAAMREAAGGE